MKPVVVLITAGGCPHCNNLKAFWPKIQKTLGNQARFVDIVVPTLSDPFPDGYFDDLSKSRHWYPMIWVFKEGDYEKAMKNHSQKTRFEVFNGTTQDGKVTRKPAGSFVRPTEENIIHWIKGSLELVKTGGPNLATTMPKATPSSSKVKETPKEAVKEETEDSRPFTVHSSIFVPTCERQANITPTIQNGGYAPF